MSKKPEVVIIGAGVIGCSIAFHLARKGVAACIVEKESIGSRASGKAWAVIEHPAYYLAVQGAPAGFWSMGETDSIAQWQDLFWSAYYRLGDLAQEILEKGKIDIEYGVSPMTALARSESAEAYFKGFMDLLEKHGFHEYQWLEADELRAEFPTLNPDVRGGLSLPQMQVEPYKFTLGLAQAAEAMGAEIRSGEAAGFEKQGDRIIAVKLASGGRIEADAVVIAMGPWSRAAGSWLGLDIPMAVVLEECLRVRPRTKLPMHSLAGGVEILSRVSGDVILAAAEVQSKAQYFTSKARPDFSAELTEEVKTRNIEAAMALLPALEDADLVEQRGDLLAYGPDPVYHKPVMGRIPGYGNAYLATRYGGLGIHQSVGTGEIMADFIADGRPPFYARRLLEHLSPA